ncbi:MAG: hypothetical protein JM58_09455 [Peptococcaceae bacterium BICA1-8]|nr:MAG: hypothetical protein JM58_09455 [Peptococcaceae bacterium BICA1-8]
MAIGDFNYTPTDGLDNTTSFPSKPGSGTAARAQFMTVLNQIKTFMNGTQKTAINANETAIAEYGTDFTNNQCIVYNNASQAIADSTLTALAMNTEVVDGDTMHDTVTNNSRVTIKKAGTYQIVADATYDSNATGVRRLYVRKGGSTILKSIFQNAVSGTQTSMSVSAAEPLVVDNYIEAVAYQNSGGALNVRGDTTYACRLSVIRLGD